MITADQYSSPCPARAMLILLLLALSFANNDASNAHSQLRLARTIRSNLQSKQVLANWNKFSHRNICKRMRWSMLICYWGWLRWHAILKMLFHFFKIVIDGNGVHGLMLGIITEYAYFSNATKSQKTAAAASILIKISVSILLTFWFCFLLERSSFWPQGYLIDSKKLKTIQTCLKTWKNIKKRPQDVQISPKMPKDHHKRMLDHRNGRLIVTMDVWPLQLTLDCCSVRSIVVTANSLLRWPSVHCDGQMPFLLV